MSNNRKRKLALITTEAELEEARQPAEEIERNGVEVVAIEECVFEIGEAAKGRQPPPEFVVLEAQIGEHGQLGEVGGQGTRHPEALYLDLRDAAALAVDVGPQRGPAGVLVVGGPFQDLRVVQAGLERHQDCVVAGVRGGLGGEREEGEEEREEEQRPHLSEESQLGSLDSRMKEFSLLRLIYLREGGFFAREDLCLLKRRLRRPIHSINYSLGK